ncbi:MAG: ribosome maturation factor RimP [Actinomycetota bacterium]|nr:MAG: ribosome maturation factor RimP [Actinomycetota bacterium]
MGVQPALLYLYNVWILEEVSETPQRIEDKLRALAEESLADQGLEILDIEFKGGALRITLDGEAPLDLDRISHASTLISHLIDDSVEFDDMGQFTLEVSSPGLERTLRTESHFKRFIGSNLSLKMKPEFDGPRRFTGALKSVDAGSIVVVSDDSSSMPSTEFELRIDEIERAHTVFEWGQSKSPKIKSGNGSKRVGKSKMTANKTAKD